MPFASITDLINAGLDDKTKPQGYMSSLFDDPEYRRMRAFDMMGNIGAALLKASSPTTAPTDFGSVLAQGLAGATTGQQNSEDRYLRRLMTASQVKKNESEMARDKEWGDLLTSPGPTTATPGASPAVPTAGGGDPASAIAGIESGGKYDAVGPVANSKGNRAYGKYQVMDFNVGPWTQEVLGKAMTPQEFIANPQAQDAVFKAKFGQYQQQYGSPEAASRAWFAGPGGMNNPSAADVNGMTVQGYGQKFAQAYGRGATGPQVAQGDAVPPSDGSGNPVQPVQYNPQAARPQTIQDVISTMPEGVRKMVAAMPRKDGMAVVMKYADPGSESAIDTTTGQVVFVPKTLIGRDPRFQPVEGAKLQIERDKLANSRRATDNTIANSDVTIGADGRPVVNQTVVDAKKAVSAAQGTDPSSKITVELAQDAIKRNNEWQSAGLKAQSSLNRLGALNTLLDQITTGKFAGSTAQLKATAKAAGIDLDAMGIKDDVGVAQAVTALTNLMALENRDPSGGAGMPGAMSDADRAFLQEAGPSITKDPRGNKILISIKKGDLQRQADIAKFAREYIKSPEFKANPAGIDDFVSEKIAGKDYYDPNILGGQSVAPPGTIPPPPAGFTTPGNGAAPSIPAPPAGFRMVK